VAILVERSAAG